MNRKEPKDASSRSSIQVIGISEKANRKWKKKIMRDNGIQFPGIKEKHF